MPQIMENLTWVAVGLVSAAYITQRHRAVAKKEPDTVTLDASYEVDPTRWSHDGEQPSYYHTGNRMHEADQEVLALRKELDF